MVKGWYTQREFAAAAGISTATVVKMVRSGRIQKPPEGRIPASELRKFLVDTMKKHSDNGTLILCVGKSEEEIAALKESVEKEYQEKGLKVRSFDSIDGIIRTAAGYTPTDVGMKLYIVKYNRQVLDTFIKKYRGSAKEYFSSLIESNRFPEFSNLPASVAYGIVFYGRADVDLDSIAGCLPVIQREMDARFNALVEELCLTGDGDKPLFRRVDLDADFYNKSGAVYGMFVGDDPLLLKNCGRIKQDVTQSVLGTHLRKSIGVLLDGAFYTICNVGDGSDYLELIGSGVYGRIVLDAGSSPVPDDLGIVLKLVESGGRCAVSVI